MNIGSDNILETLKALMAKQEALQQQIDSQNKIILAFLGKASAKS